MELISIFLILALATSSVVASGASAADQLIDFLNGTCGAVGLLTTTYGVPVTKQDADGTLASKEDLLWNVYMMERLSAINRENPPQRIVHGKGAGAKGYFKVTHDVTHITNVAAFNKIGKTMPVAVRFSSALADKGTADTKRGGFSLSAKFYTEEGNWDFTGFQTDTFFIKDPLDFASAVHVNFRNPKTGLSDPNALLDFFFSRPESLDFLLQFLGDPGIPASYRNIPAHGLHTIQLENDDGEINFARFVFTPDQGELYLNTTQGMTIAGQNADFFIEDLYNAIAGGKYPSWTVGFQVINEKDVDKIPFDIFDISVRWPKSVYKVQPIGKLVLDKNPENFFKDVEQLAFNPGNMPDGMRGCDNTILMRTFAYRDAAIYRMGINYNNAEVNRPLNEVWTYNRNGYPAVRDNFGGTPNYYPNSFNGPVPTSFTRNKRPRTIAKTVSGATNFKQAGEYYRSLTQDHKDRLLGNLVPLLGSVYDFIKKKGMELFAQIDPNLANSIAQGLEKLAASQQVVTN